MDRLLTEEEMELEWHKAIVEYDRLMPNSLNDYERELWGKVAIGKVASAKTARWIMDRIDGMIFYRHDAPYKTTIDWEDYQALKKSL